MSSHAFARLNSGIERRKEHELVVLSRLEFALQVHEADLAQGLPRLEELADEVIAGASELVADEALVARDAALEDLVMPFLRGSGGQARLASGWDTIVGDRLEFYGRQSGERLERAKTDWLDEVRQVLEEAEAFGWSEQTTLDSLGAVRIAGPFRTALREAVASLIGQAWTETWLAAWRGLEVTREVMDRARVA